MIETALSPEAAHLSSRLLETASGLRRDKVVADEELIAAFLSVAMTLAETSQGPAFAAAMAQRLAEVETRQARTTVN